MLVEKNKFEFTVEGYEEARDYLKSIGEWSRVESLDGAFAGITVVREANAIKARQIMLTE